MGRAMKRCKRCNKDKRVGEFYRNSTTLDGRDGKCKACRKEMGAGAKGRGSSVTTGGL